MKSKILSRTTATALVKKQLIFREGGVDFLFLKRTYKKKKGFVI